MKKKDKKFLLEMNRMLLNQAVAGVPYQNADKSIDRTEGLEGAAYIESLQEAERTKNFNMSIESKELEIKYLELEKKFKELKSSVKKPTERMIRMEEKIKSFKAELKASESKNKKLDKRMKELEKCVLFIIRQKAPFYSITEFNKEAKRFERSKAYTTSADIFYSYSPNLIEGGKNR